MEWDELVKLGQLLVSLGALVLIVRLFLQGYIARNKTVVSDGACPQPNIPAWVHTLYIGAIAAFVLLEFTVYVVLGNYQRDDILNTISFGATLSSLIMSVVAIIFTIVSGKNGQEQLGKVSEATRELKETARSLGEFRAITQQIDQHIESLFKNVDTRINSLDGKIDERIAQLNASIGEVGRAQSQLKDMISTSTTSANTNENEIRDSAKLLITNGSYLGAVLLLSCAYAKTANKPLCFEEMGPDFSGNSREYIQGYLVASAACGVVVYEDSLPDVTIKNVADNIEEYAIPKIKAFINSRKNDWRNKNIIAFNTMRAYFGLSPMTFDEDDVTQTAE